MGEVAPGNWEDNDHKYYTDKRTILDKSRKMERQLNAIENSQIQGEIRAQLKELQDLIKNDDSLNSNQIEIQKGRDNLKKVSTARNILSNIQENEINSNKELCTFAVQTLLRTMGYFDNLANGNISSKDRVDAIAKDKTKEAVTAFQQAYNAKVGEDKQIKETGKIDYATIQALLEETGEHENVVDDPDKRNKINEYINELAKSDFDTVISACSMAPNNNWHITTIENIKKFINNLQDNEKNSEQVKTLMDNIQRIEMYIQIGKEYSQILKNIRQADVDNGFDNKRDEVKTTISPGNMNTYREQIKQIKNIEASSYSKLPSNDQPKLQTLISKINTELHQKEKEYEAYRAEQIKQDSLIEKLLKDADVINKAITNYNDEEIKKEEYHFKKGEYRKDQKLSDILRSNKRPKIKKGKEEYTYQTSGNDLQTLKGSSQQYKAIVNAIEQGQSKDDIRNNLNTLLYQEIAEEPAGTSSVTPTATEQTPGTEINEGEQVISEKEFETLCHKEKINKKEREKIIKYANQNKLDELELWCENIPPFNLLDNKDIYITMHNKKCELNKNNIDNIKEMTFFLDFRHLNITTDISSLQCSYLQVGYLSTDRNYLKGFQGDLMIDRSHGTVNSDLSEFKCPSLYLGGKLSNDERKYVKGFKKRLDIEIDNFDSLPDLSEVQCSSLNLNVPEHFNIDTISDNALQNLLKYQKKLRILEDKDDGDDYIDITEKVKKRMDALQNN